MNTDVIILSRTKMSEGKICVGGLDLNSGKMLRLLDNRASALTSDFPYKIGETYAITFEQRYQLIAPHLEDVAVYNYELKSNCNNVALNKIAHGNSNTYNNLSELFSGKLHWQNNRGYVLASDPPDFSPQTAKINKKLVKVGLDYKEFGFSRSRTVKYVGDLDISKMPGVINEGTPIRFSLARPWDKDKNGIKVCYLQMSGVYLL